IGGFLTISLALLSVDVPLLSDAFAVGLSLFAFKIAINQATYNNKYGFRRFEIIYLWVNGVILIEILFLLFFEAWQRFTKPPEVSASMMIIATIGLVVNILVFFILMRGDSQENLNIKSALLHVLGDLLGSIGAIIAGLLIYLFGWNIADPIASVLVSVLILISGMHIAKDALHILME